MDSNQCLEKMGTAATFMAKTTPGVVFDTLFNKTTEQAVAITSFGADTTTL